MYVYGNVYLEGATGKHTSICVNMQLKMFYNQLSPLDDLFLSITILPFHRPTETLCQPYSLLSRFLKILSVLPFFEVLLPVETHFISYMRCARVLTASFGMGCICPLLAICSSRFSIRLTIFATSRPLHLRLLPFSVILVVYFVSVL